MRSYEAARSLFGFLAFLAWAVVVIGGIAALIAGGGVTSHYGGGAAFLAMMPGIGLSLVGFILVAFVQMGRANVDTAEYTQQMLKIARDQLEVSRQALNSESRDAVSFTTKFEETTDKTGPSFSDVNVSKQAQIETPPEARTEDATEKTAAPSTPVSARVALGLEDGVLEYGGQTIEVRGGKFLVAEMTFARLAGAQDYVDQTSADTSSKLSGVRRS